MFENDKNKIQQAWRESVVDFTHKLADYELNIQNIHTPFELCYEIVHKLDGFSGGLKDKRICTLNIEFIEVLMYEFGITPGNITFITDNSIKKRFIIGSERYKGVNVMRKDKSLLDIDLFEEKKEPRKFDCIIMNPPYQTKSNIENTKTQAIWDKFVKKAVEICKKDGYIGAIHPSGWRSGNGIFADAKVIKEKQIEYLEIHGEQDGLKTFKVTTRYDWYIVKNCPVNHNTLIVDQDNISSQVNLKEISFIPNNMIDKIFSLLAKNNQKRVEIISDSSYHTQRKDRMSEIKHDDFVYPIVYSTPIDGPTIWYSNTNKNGHFGISKLILNPCRPLGFVIDEKGEYGMSQFCVGIVGDKEYLNMVAEVIKNQKTNGFADFMEACHFTDKIFNKDVISQLRKDFWRGFFPWEYIVEQSIIHFCKKHDINLFSRKQLIDEELDTIIEWTGTKGKTPAESLSFYLQQLRDKNIIKFLGNGKYEYLGILE